MGPRDNLRASAEKNAISHRSALVPILFAAICSVVLAPGQYPVQAQSQATAQNTSAPALPNYEFDVVSIKLLDNFADAGGATFEPGGIIARNISLWWLIRMAYGAQHGEVFNTPKWIDDVRFNFEARTDADTAATLQRLSNEQQTLARQQMLRAVLSDRFKLTAHFEPRELPAYLLTVAPDGPKLQSAKSASDDPKAISDIHGNRLAGVVSFRTEANPGQEGYTFVVIGQSVSTTEFAAQLSRQMEHPVVDKTALSGVYDFTLRFAYQPMLTGTGEGGVGYYDNPMTGRSFSNALEKDLGLKLTAGKSSIKMLVIDHVERPSPN